MDDERELTPGDFAMLLAVAWRYVVFFDGAGVLKVRFEHVQDGGAHVVTVRPDARLPGRLQFILEAEPRF